MRVVEWEDRYSLGIDMMDSHHRHLVDLLNRTYFLISFEHRDDEINYIFNELIDYTEFHLITEEHLMREIDYPRMYSHISEHELFKCKLNELQASQVTVDAKYYTGVIFFLEEWLLSHILLTDKEFAEYVININRIADFANI